MAELWLPGAVGPSLEDFVDRLNKAVAAFAERHGIPKAVVDVELADGVRYTVESIRPEPGYGFVTLDVHCGTHEDGCPAELIVPVGSLKRIELDLAEERRGRFGFSLPDGDASA